MVTATLDATAHPTAPRRRAGARTTLTAGSALGLGIAVTWFSLLVLIPLTAIVATSAERGWSGYIDTITNPQTMAAIRLTVGQAALVTGINVVMGTLIAWVLVRDRFWGKRILDVIIDIPFALPTIVAGLVLLGLYGTDAKVRKELRDWLRRLHDEVHVTTVFVTHDQEEAMEVADEIVVINHGRVGQVGSPDELYDEPASEFVMGFLGEVTRLGPVRLRPHDVEVAVTPGRAGAFPGSVTRLLRVGFEVRLQVELDREFGAGAGPVSVVLSRSHSRSLDLELGSKVWLTPAVGAVTVPAMVAV